MGMEYRQTNSSRSDGKSCKTSIAGYSSALHPLNLSAYMCSCFMDGLENMNSWRSSGIRWGLHVIVNEEISLPWTRTFPRAAVGNNGLSRSWIGRDLDLSRLIIVLDTRSQETRVHRDGDEIRAERQWWQTWEVENKSSSVR